MPYMPNKWPERIDQQAFAKDAQMMSIWDQAQKYNIGASTVRGYRAFLRSQGIATRAMRESAGSSPILDDSQREEFIADTFTMKNSELGEKYNISIRTVGNYKAKYRQQGNTVGSAGIPKPLGRSFNDQLRLELPSFVVISDCEIPDHDPTWFELVIDVAEKWGVDSLVINGDFVAFDSLSSWMRQLARHTTLEDELKVTKQALRAFRETFNNVYYLMGNHERRLPHAIEGQLSLASQLKDVEGVIVSDYPYCWIESSGKHYLVCHQDNYSRIPLAVPLQLSNIYQYHIIAGHTHRLAEGYSKSGEHRLIEGGHMRDLDKTAYKALRLNTHPAWTQGFVLVLDGIPWALDREKAYFFLDGFQQALGGK